MKTRNNMKKELVESGKISNGMPKEIANKTKGETYPVRERAASNGAGYKCLPVQIFDLKICLGTHCRDETYPVR